MFSYSVVKEKPGDSEKRDHLFCGKFFAVNLIAAQIMKYTVVIIKMGLGCRIWLDFGVAKKQCMKRKPGPKLQTLKTSTQEMFS